MTHCEFGEILEDMLRDRIVSRVSNSHIQCRLLNEPKLTFAKVAELSQSMESAKKNYTIISQRDTAQVHLTRTICYRCGNEHSPDIYAIKESYCRKCSKRDKLPEHVVVARLMLTDSKLKEPQPTNPASTT